MKTIELTFGQDTDFEILNTVMAEIEAYCFVEEITEDKKELLLYKEFAFQILNELLYKTVYKVVWLTKFNNQEKSIISNNFNDHGIKDFPKINFYFVIE